MIYDLHIDGTPDQQQIAHLLSTLFEVEAHQVQMLQSHEELMARAHVSVICIPRTRSGEFPLSLEIIVWGSARLSEEEIALAFSRHFQCASMITDDAANPYYWTLITREGDLLQAEVDVEALDREELRVVRISHCGGAA